VSDLVEFLEARLDDDEAMAREGAEHAPEGSARWHAAYSRDDLDPAFWIVATAPLSYTPLAGPDLPPGLARHIARWDPARVLAEVAAKRRILGMVERTHRESDDYPGWEGAALHLALPYADHPDFDPAWRLA
jgi:hypothetical protein